MMTKKVWLNIAAYGVTAALFGFAINYISATYSGADRKLYIAALLLAAVFFGRLLNWLVLVVFREDISK